MDVMENTTKTANAAKIFSTAVVLTLLLALTGCESEDTFPNDCFLCEPEDFEDHVLKVCPIYYRWNGWFNSWTACDNNWTPVANQPVFTSLNDCLIAKGHLIDENETYYDNSQEDKDRGVAWKLFCFNAN